VRPVYKHFETVDRWNKFFVIGFKRFWNERKIIFYTGLTMQLFLWVLTKVSICAKLCVKTMSMQDHLLLVLMKLRLGLLNRDLAFRFNLSDTSVSRIINQWIPNIAKHKALHILILWLIPIKITALSNQCRILFFFRLSCYRKILILAPVFPT
jgi:hypothetical protein